MAIERVQQNRTKTMKVDISEPIDTSESIGRVVSYDSKSEDEEEEDISTLMSFHGKMVYRYKNLRQLQSDFENRNPISLVRFTDGTFASILCDNTAALLVCSDYIDTCLGASYHNWILSLEVVAPSKPVINYCLLLPKMMPTGVPSNVNDASFTLIESEWMDMQLDKRMALPKFIGASY